MDNPPLLNIYGSTPIRDAARAFVSAWSPCGPVKAVVAGFAMLVVVPLVIVIFFVVGSQPVCSPAAGGGGSRPAADGDRPLMTPMSTSTHRALRQAAGRPLQGAVSRRG